MSKSNKVSSSRNYLIKYIKSGMEKNDKEHSIRKSRREQSRKNKLDISNQQQQLIEYSKKNISFDASKNGSPCPYDTSSIYDDMTEQFDSTDFGFVEKLSVINLSGQNSYNKDYIYSNYVVKFLNNVLKRIDTFYFKTTLKILILEHNSLKTSDEPDVVRLCKNMKTLGNFVNLTELTFSYIVDSVNTQVFDSLAEVLPRLKFLRTLNLSGNFIDKEYMIILLKSIMIINIESLNLSNTTIDPYIIKKILPQFLTPNLKKEYTPKIKELIIKDNEIGDVDLEALEIALRVNKTLTKLDISNNKISDDKKEALKKAFGDILIL